MSLSLSNSASSNKSIDELKIAKNKQTLFQTIDEFSEKAFATLDSSTTVDALRLLSFKKRKVKFV